LERIESHLFCNTEKEVPPVGVVIPEALGFVFLFSDGRRS